MLFTSPLNGLNLTAIYKPSVYELWDFNLCLDMFRSCFYNVTFSIANYNLKYFELVAACNFWDWGALYIVFLRWHWELQHPASLLKHVAFCVLTDNNKTRSFAYFYVLFTTPPFLFAGPPAVPWTLLVVLRLSEVCSQLDFWQSLNHCKIKTQQQQQQHFSKKLTRNSIVKCDGWEKERWWISPFLSVIL